MASIVFLSINISHLTVLIIAAELRNVLNNNLVSLLAAPVIIAYQKPGQISFGLIFTGVVSSGIIVGAIIFSKRGGFKKQPFEV